MPTVTYENKTMVMNRKLELNEDSNLKFIRGVDTYTGTKSIKVRKNYIKIICTQNLSVIGIKSIKAKYN